MPPSTAAAKRTPDARARGSLTLVTAPAASPFDPVLALATADDLAAGSGVGLSLSRRIAGRFGGVLELAPHPSGGTRATVEFAEARA